MATAVDEFDPSEEVLNSFTHQVLIPALDSLSRDTEVPYVATVDVWVRDQEIPKFSLCAGAFGKYDVEENTVIRVRFRRTYRDDRILFSFETQHADVWRATGFSGIWCHGDVRINGNNVTAQLKSKTVSHSGWHGW